MHLFGSVIGQISYTIISLCLAFAAGAMLYIITGELIPEANNLYKGRMSAVGNILRIFDRNNCSKNIKITPSIIHLLNCIIEGVKFILYSLKQI